uniref:ShTK domain protein n=1 Tax=Ascaris lumbricoides TaxID=6252 RepID=A0A0M3HW24_ASCLU
MLEAFQLIACLLQLQRMATTSRHAFQEEADRNAWPPAIPDFLQPGPVAPGSRGQVASNPYDCMTLTCLCPYFRGNTEAGNQCILPSGEVLKMSYRKEYRMLTDDERNRWHYALTQLKRSGEYDQLSMQHQVVGSGSGAHSGPGFLPWHREYLKRFEIALRLIDPTVAIPYWDTVMDNYLQDPRDSILFSPIFAGETDFFGNVVTGPFAYWSTLEGRSAILRNLGQEGALFTENNLLQVISQTNIEYVMAYTAPLMGCPFPINFFALEYAHSNVHLWIGGNMKPPDSSSNDPIFFMHHSFVDFIWELWREARQPRWIRESAYSPDLPQCADPQHFSWAVMRPFSNLINRDGLSNMYTDQLYRYAPRASCTAAMPTCGSPYLFCDIRGSPHCVSKVKINGLCAGYEGLDACFNGVCIMGSCVPGPTPAPFRPQTLLPAVERAQVSQAWQNRTFVDCFNRNQCCEQWARDGECRRNAQYMRQYCSAACHTCRPAYNTSNECADRHISCQQWRTDGQCSGNSGQFMQENCRSSCGLCATSKAASCGRNLSGITNVTINGNGIRRAPSKKKRMDAAAGTNRNAHH